MLRITSFLLRPLTGLVLVTASLTSTAQAQSGHGIASRPDSDGGRVVITAVRDGSPAAAAGLRSGDRVVVLGDRDETPRAGGAWTMVGLLRGSSPIRARVTRGDSTWVIQLGTRAVVGANAATSLGSGESTVPAFDQPTTVPSFDRPATVPSFDRPTTVPSFDRPTTVPSLDAPTRVPTSGASGPVTPAPRRAESPAPTREESNGLASRAWRADCAALRGPRPGRTYAWLSTSGSATERLWLNTDGSYALHRSSAYSSYAEDGCYAIGEGTITFYRVASSALANAPGATSDTRVSLGSSSARFDRRMTSLRLLDGGRRGLILDGERYEVSSDR